MNQIRIEILTAEQLEEIILLLSQLNPNLSSEIIRLRQLEMFNYPNYNCFGLYKQDELIGLCSGWVLVKIYSGKQLELDNVIIDKAHQSNGYGEQFILLLENWAKENDCKSIELNTYTQNTRSHKFYCNQGYEILGFHFLKKV